MTLGARASKILDRWVKTAKRERCTLSALGLALGVSPKVARNLTRRGARQRAARRQEAKKLVVSAAEKLRKPFASKARQSLPRAAARRLSVRTAERVTRHLRVAKFEQRKRNRYSSQEEMRKYASDAVRVGYAARFQGWGG